MGICVQNRINVSEDDLKREKVYKSLRRVLNELLRIRKRSARFMRVSINGQRQKKKFSELHDRL